MQRHVATAEGELAFLDQGQQIALNLRRRQLIRRTPIASAFLVPMLGYCVIAWFALKASQVLRPNGARAFQ